jgi:hypothetical protein
MAVFKDTDAALRYIESSSKRVLSVMDGFWTIAKEKGWFDNKELMNHVMFLEHEASRAMSMNNVAVSEIRSMNNVLPSS